ncbi:hypothetical protein C5S36_09690 [Candidatus Methanophagaceae archaeon]|nr:hypothetical protein C5S36_09690 [Methanophagales archaeon]
MQVTENEEGVNWLMVEVLAKHKELPDLTSREKYLNLKPFFY